MKNNKLVAISALLLAMGMVGCDVSSEPAEHVHKAVEAWTNDANYHWHKCEGEECNEKLDRAKHTWIDDVNHPDVPATCTVAGKDYSICSICGKTKEAEIAPLDHLLGETPTTTVAATHYADGYEEFVCQREGCGETVRQTLPKGEHEMMDMFSLDHVEGYADMTVYQCTGDKFTRYAWSAGDVVEGTEGMIVAQSGGGWQFNNHPIGNAIENPSSDEHAAVPQNGFAGDSFNFKVKAPFSKQGAKLVARLTPSRYASGDEVPVWKAPADNVSKDWTYGIKFADANDQEGTPITDYRYIITVNGVSILPADPSTVEDEVATATGWYEVPGSFDMTKDQDLEIKITMAGGWLSTFFEFGFEIEAETKYTHQHILDGLQEVPGEAGVKSGYSKGTCRCGDTGIVVPVTNWTEKVNGSNDSGTYTTSPIKLGKNGTKLTYKVNLEKPITGKIFIRGWVDHYDDSNHNKLRGFFVGGSANVKFTVNGTAVEITNKSTYEAMGIKDGENEAAAAVCEIGAASLIAGENTIVWERLGSYGLTAYDLRVIGEEGEAPVQPGPEPQQGEAVKFEVSSAAGYNDSSAKMNAKSGESASAVWTTTNATLAAGTYSVKINAKMTSSDHADRKWYNMAKAELCVGGTAEETRSNSPDEAGQDDFRYFLKVNNTVANPDEKDSWSTIGLTNTEFNTVNWISTVTVGADLSTLSLCHGNIGFSLYIAYIEFTPIAA